MDEFEKKLIEYEAEFSIELVNTIFANVTKMLPEHFRQKEVKDLKEKVMNEDLETEHFVKRKMLSDEPDHGMFASVPSKEGPEESKFTQSDNHDKGFLAKKYPSLALPNAKNKDEIDILADLDGIIDD